jgi:hypothetical protein
MMSIASLNNEGVSLLLSGENARSISVFQNALIILKQAATLAEESPSGAPTGFVEAADSESLNAMSPLQKSNLALPNMQSDSNYIYNQPFLLADNFAAHGSMESMLPFYSAVLLFNIALACHQQGLLGKESSLKRASHLYRMSLHLLENFSHRTTAATTAAIAVLTVATLNNKAQVQFELCDYKHSHHCLLALSKLLCDVRPIIHGELNTTVLEEIILNSMLLDPPSAAHAA